MIDLMNEAANKAVHGDFLATVTAINDGFDVSVRHYKHIEDPCAGQHQVVSELYKVLEALELETETGKRGDVSHSGGCASVLSKKEKTAEEDAA